MTERGFFNSLLRGNAGLSTPRSLIPPVSSVSHINFGRRAPGYCVTTQSIVTRTTSLTLSSLNVFVRDPVFSYLCLPGQQHIVGIAASIDMRQACLTPRNDRTNDTKVCFKFQLFTKQERKRAKSRRCLSGGTLEFSLCVVRKKH